MTRFIFVLHLVAVMTVVTPSRLGAQAAARARLTSSSAPDCSGVNRWPTTMALTYLQNGGFIDRGSVDSSKTHTTRIASQSIGRQRYRQVHDVVFTERTGHVVEAIVVSDVTNQECSTSSTIDVYVVAMHLDGKEPPR